MCYVVRLSGGQIGFHNMSYSEAILAATELGAISSASLYTKGGLFSKSFFKGSLFSESFFKVGLFSESFFNVHKQEVFTWNRWLAAGQVFDPPREVAPQYLINRTI